MIFDAASETRSLYLLPDVKVSFLSLGDILAIILLWNLTIFFRRTYEVGGLLEQIREDSSFLMPPTVFRKKIFGGGAISVHNIDKLETLPNSQLPTALKTLIPK